MRKIFILGGSYLQLDLILEAKKMFFYTYVLDANEECIGAKWCDTFLHVDIADKELVLKKAKKYNVDFILTSATELGNLTACYVAWKLKLPTNSYTTALKTTDKFLMKQVLRKNGIKTAKFQILDKKNIQKWKKFPSIVKPSDASSAKGVTKCNNNVELLQAFTIAKKFSRNGKVLIEEFIEGKQYSCETISSFGRHQILTYDKEYINNDPIIEERHKMSSKINKKLLKYDPIIYKILDAFHIQFGAAHIEFRIKNGKLYVIEVASRTGGMRSEMMQLAFGLNYSRLLLFAYLGVLPKIKKSFAKTVYCNFLINYNAYKKYLAYKQDKNYLCFEPFAFQSVAKTFQAEHLGESKGYYYTLRKNKI